MTRRLRRSFATLRVLSCYGIISGLVLLFTHVFHPIHNLAVLLFLDGDVRHGRGRRSSVPVFLAGREPDHVTGTYFFNRTAPPLRPPAARSHDESLSQRMRVPCR